MILDTPLAGIEVVSEKTGLSPVKIRYSEDLGLVNPERTKDLKGNRGFTPLQIIDLEWMASERRKGVSLQNIQDSLVSRQGQRTVAMEVLGRLADLTEQDGAIGLIINALDTHDPLIGFDGAATIAELSADQLFALAEGKSSIEQAQNLSNQLNEILELLAKI